jgi:hypothetical protein
MSVARLSFSLALPVVASALFGAFLCGLLASRLLVPEAHAQSSALASTIYVPSDGLVFRTFDGHVIAKLSHDSRGGVLELFDEHEHPSAAIRSDGLGSPTTAATPAAASPDTRPVRKDLGF